MTKGKNEFVSILLIGIILASFSFAKTGNKLPFIHVEGKDFVNEAGEIVIFRGVSTSDPDKLEKEGMWNKQLFEELKEWGINVVRFPIHPQAWRERGEDDYLKLVDDGVKWAEENNTYVIIDWHSIGNIRTGLFHHKRYNTTTTETFRFWRTIAMRYEGNPTVAFYELFNEPTTDQGKFGRISWEEHKEFMEELIGVIHAHNAKAIYLVAGFNWAYDLTDMKFSPIASPNVAYVTHPYPQKREKPWIEKWEADWGFAADQYPIMATELGFMKADGLGAHSPVIVEDLEYGETIVNYFNQKGISWVAWVFDPVWSPQMIKSWNFEPTIQGEFFKTKMIELNK